MPPRHQPPRSASRRSLLPFVFLAALAPSFALADTAPDKAEMQRKLNAETLQKPFAVEDAAKVDAYVADAMKRNLQPRQTPPADWQPGSTCDAYYRLHYNYTAYRDCVYYHRYYGRYW